MRQGLTRLHTFSLFSIQRDTCAAWLADLSIRLPTCSAVPLCSLIGMPEPSPIAFRTRGGATRNPSTNATDMQLRRTLPAMPYHDFGPETRCERGAYAAPPAPDAV